MRLATYTVHLEVAEGVAEATLDLLCDTLDLIDQRLRLEHAADFAVRVNKVLAPYVTVEASE